MATLALAVAVTAGVLSAQRQNAQADLAAKLDAKLLEVHNAARATFGLDSTDWIYVSGYQLPDLESGRLVALNGIVDGDKLGDAIGLVWASELVLGDYVPAIAINRSGRVAAVLFPNTNGSTRMVRLKLADDGAWSRSDTETR